MIAPIFRTHCVKIDGYCNGNKFDCATCHMKVCPKGGMVNCSINAEFCKKCQSPDHNYRVGGPRDTWVYNLVGGIAGQEY
jgi:hypothetical protein